MVVIRKATEKDLLDIIILWKDFMDYHIHIDPFWTRSEMGHKIAHDFLKTHLNNNNFHILVSIYNNRVIGYQISQILEHPPVLKKRRYCLINDIAIAEGFRGKGIGTKMFNKARNWAIRKGVDRIELQVASGNNNAIRFYEKLGMKPYTHHMYLDL